MLDFKLVRNNNTNEEWIETSITGKPLLTTPQLNKGTAFTFEERHIFGLRGKLPPQVESLAEQVNRAYQQFQTYQDDLKKNIYLTELHDRNQVLFYALVSKYLTEMLPLIYTPIVGNAVKKYSLEFRQPRGLYVAYSEIDYIDEILNNRSNPDIDLIVITDGEGVLGIGDQGIGGVDIPVAKLMVYTLCGGINPNRTLPIFLDVGTNNETLLNDPLYLGWRHPRISTTEYDVFIEKFVAAIERKFPHIFLHWEDFGRKNAQRFLNRFENRICTFNDDIQGTGIVTLAAILAGIKANQTTLAEQRIVIFGAGTAGAGIASQIYEAMRHAGLSESEAREKFWLIDQQGLLTTETPELTEAQQPFARKEKCKYRSLADTVKNVKPTILIGCSAVKGAFKKNIIQEMAKHVERPIILPLSNPTEKAEATPADLLKWTNNKALIATGSPFDPVKIQGKIITIAQCNNALVFPGIGLGIIAVKAKRLTNNMIWAACEALSHQSPILSDPEASLLPTVDNASAAAKKIAIAVAEQAKKDNVATENLNESLEVVMENIFWKPKYLPYKLL